MRVLRGRRNLPDLVFRMVSPRPRPRMHAGTYRLPCLGIMPREAGVSRRHFEGGRAVSHCGRGRGGDGMCTACTHERRRLERGVFVRRSMSTRTATKTQGCLRYTRAHGTRPETVRDGAPDQRWHARQERGTGDVREVHRLTGVRRAAGHWQRTRAQKPGGRVVHRDLDGGLRYARVTRLDEAGRSWAQRGVAAV